MDMEIKLEINMWGGMGAGHGHGNGNGVGDELVNVFTYHNFEPAPTRPRD